MVEVLFISCFVALILLVWFHSEAFIEYASFIGAGDFFYAIDFKQEQQKNPLLNWTEYLIKFHDNFIIRLITCPLCLSVWLTLGFCFFTENLFYFPICNLLSLIFYKLTIKILEW